LRRATIAGICLLGCFLSLSSAALMSFSIILAAFTYDRLMKQYSWRWIPFWVAIVSLILAISILVEHPLSSILSHLTLDPETGFYRLMIWDQATIFIAQSPVFGYAYQLFDNGILDGTVDSIWLVIGLRFGVPMIILFCLTNVAATIPTRQERHGTGDVHMDQ